MPTYRNDNSFDVVVVGQRIGGKETLSTPIFVASLPAGVVKISDSPFYHPVIVSEIKTGGVGDVESIAVPQVVNGVSVEGVTGTVYCSSGEVEVRFNVDSVQPPIILGSGFTYKVGVRERLIDVIHLKFTVASSKVIVNLERG